jgi:hypothetical protein
MPAPSGDRPVASDLSSPNGGLGIVDIIFQIEPALECARSRYNPAACLKNQSGWNMIKTDVEII